MKFSMNDLYPNSGYSNSVSTHGESIPEDEERDSYTDTITQVEGKSVVVPHREIILGAGALILALFLLNVL